jgi:uncharacterized membrane protein
MMPTTYQWLLALHLAGVVFWVSGLLACALLVPAAGQAVDAARAPLVSSARRLALLMDIGATVAIAAGLTLALGVAPALMRQPWMHIKLTLVVLGVLGLHGLIRARLGRLRRGATAGLPGFAASLAGALVVAIIVIAIVRPLAR